MFCLCRENASGTGCQTLPCPQGERWHVLEVCWTPLFILKIMLVTVAGNQVPSHLKQHPSVTCCLVFCLRMVCCERKRKVKKTYERCIVWVSTFPVAVLGPVCASWGCWLIFWIQKVSSFSQGPAENKLYRLTGKWNPFFTHRRLQKKGKKKEKKKWSWMMVTFQSSKPLLAAMNPFCKFSVWSCKYLSRVLLSAIVRLRTRIPTVF